MKPFSAVALRAPGLLLLGAAEAGGAGSILVQAEQQRGGQATLGELRARSAQASKVNQALADDLDSARS